MIEEIRKFRLQLVEFINDDSSDKDLKPAVANAINALMQVEFIDYCKQNS